MSPVFLLCAHTLDGSFIFGADMPEEFRSRLGRHFDAGDKPHIGYEYDYRQHPVPAFPYTVWKREDNKLVGTPCKTFDEVCKAWGR